MTDNLEAELALIKAKHAISTRTTPAVVMIWCSCGWRHQETRRQNALARAAKVSNAIVNHLRTVHVARTPGDRIQ